MSAHYAFTHIHMLPACTCVYSVHIYMFIYKNINKYMGNIQNYSEVLR